MLFSLTTAMQDSPVACLERPASKGIPVKSPAPRPSGYVTCDDSRELALEEEAHCLVAVPDQNLEKVCRNEWWWKKHIDDDTGILGDEFVSSHESFLMHHMVW